MSDKSKQEQVPCSDWEEVLSSLCLVRLLSGEIPTFCGRIDLSASSISCARLSGEESSSVHRCG